ncbi:MAG: hypothetical protein ACPG8W_13555 [Candidatus Promineifilaceae bacterium]
MTQNLMLQAAGVCAIIVALYHGVVGDRLVQAMAIEPAGQKQLMRGSFHIGTMGWLTGGILLFVAATLDAGLARNAIVLAYAFVFGIPAIGQVVMSKGRPNFGMVMLILVVILSLLGR